MTHWQAEKASTVVETSPQQFQCLLQQVESQIELLLYVALKLDLQLLLNCALQFMRSNFRDLTLDEAEGTVFSPRVLAAVGGSRSGAQLFSQACLSQQLGSGFGMGLFSNIQFIQTSIVGEVFFNGTLLRDMYAFKAGAEMQVWLFKDGTASLRSKNSKKRAVTLPFAVMMGLEPQQLRVA